ncbi:allD operon transcriptional activator [Gammaproteobacteria bacterium]|nr:allD operon transcriptional activator [Gammaproteobacteria bacterium]
MLDSETMRSFVNVAETSSFSKAAKLMNKTAATISYRIKMLEESLGTPLFLRTTRAVNLTPAGIHLLEQCRQWLTWIDTMPSELREINNGVEREVKIVINNLLYDADSSAKLLNHLHKEFPFTQFHFSRQVYMGVWDRLLHDDYQLAIGVSGTESLSNSINIIPLGEVSWVFVVPKNHPLSKHVGNIPEKILRDYPAINVEDTSRHLHKRVAWLLRGQKEIKVPNLKTKLKCHLHGLGIGFLPKNICDPYLKSGELIECHIFNTRTPSGLSIAYNKDTVGKSVKQIIDLFDKQDEIVMGFLNNIDIKQSDIELVVNEDKMLLN